MYLIQNIQGLKLIKNLGFHNSEGTHSTAENLCAEYSDWFKSGLLISLLRI